MTFGRPTTMEEILGALAGRIASALALSADYVFPSLDLGETEGEGGPADTFVVLTGPGGRAEKGDVDGGGNQLLTIDGTVTVELWNRAEVDLHYQDAAALKDATLGILARWNKLLGAAGGLQMFAPTRTGDATWSLLKEPMRLLTWDLRPRGKTGWTKLVSRWELKYVQDQTG